MRSRKTSRTGAAARVLLTFLMLRSFMYAQVEVRLSVEPELGGQIAIPRNADVGLCMSGPGQLDKCVKASINGIAYTIGYRKRGPRRNVVTYIHTDDPTFKSPEGLRVGDIDTVENLEGIISAPGFEIYGKKGDGWVPVIGFNGEVDVVHDGQADEKRKATGLGPSMENPVRLRITGFTMRRKPS